MPADVAGTPNRGCAPTPSATSGRRVIRRRSHVLRSLLLPIALLAAGYHGACMADPLAKKSAELSRLKTQIQVLRRQLDIAQGKQDTLRTQLRDIETRIGDTTRDLRHTNGALRREQDKLTDLSRARRRHEAELGRQREALAQQVRASFVIGRQGYLKLLLDQQDPATVSRNLTYFDYFNRARSGRIRAVAAQLDQLNTLKQAIDHQVQILGQLHTRQQREIDSLQVQRQARALLLAKVNARIQTKGEALTRLLDNERRLEALIQRLRSALADIPDNGDARPFGQLKGQLQWPARGTITARFGEPRHLGKLKWQGVLIDARPGADVHAVYHGRVAFADWLRGLGLLVIIDHGNGYMSLYGHNQSIYKQVGDWVETGDVIASVGDSGGSSRPALYFEIRHNGVPTNPVLWCKKWPSGLVRTGMYQEKPPLSDN